METQEALSRIAERLDSASTIPLYEQIAKGLRDAIESSICFLRESAALIYVLFGRTKGMRLVVIYLVAFGILDQIRAFAAQTGVPVKFGYAIDGDKHLFGVVPALHR